VSGVAAVKKRSGRILAAAAVSCDWDPKDDSKQCNGEKKKRQL
jgi:hypothetical protein